MGDEALGFALLTPTYRAVGSEAAQKSIDAGIAVAQKIVEEKAK